MKYDLAGPSIENILTFDVEDWYQGLDLPLVRWENCQNRLSIGLECIVETLAKYSTCATFFILGRVAQEQPGWVRRLAVAGHEIGTHGWSHTPIYRQTPAQFRGELRCSLEALQELSGQSVRGHRAAFFSITADSLWALEELTAVGIGYDSSIFPVHNYRYGIPCACRFPHRWPTLPLWEFPLSTLSVARLNVPFSGGFYARLWPYAWLRWAIRRLNHLGQPAIVYFHPWEFDACQPRLKGEIPWLARATHYYRLTRPPGILDALLTDFRWTTMGHCLSTRYRKTSQTTAVCKG
jgi:polysaccharide deacetylase family protein (PEP-CTERM system associated)